MPGSDAPDAALAAGKTGELGLPDGCGDGQLTPNEGCDDGNDDLNDSCVRCQIAHCGDGEVFPLAEQCDDGNLVENDGCNAYCELENCGDGLLQKLEECEGTEPAVCETSCGTEGLAVCDAASCSLGDCTPPLEACNGVDDDCDEEIDTGCLVQLNRFYNQSTGDHRYEATTIAPSGYVLEPQRFWVYQEQVPGTVPLYQKRSGNGRDHMMTLHLDEADALGYTLANIAGYVLPELDEPWDVGGKKTERICRYYHPSIHDHLYEVESAEWALAGHGYNREGCVARVWEPTYGD